MKLTAWGYGLWLHRLEQDDLGCDPWICAHACHPNGSRRIFCVWSSGVEVGPVGISSRAIRFGRRILALA